MPDWVDWLNISTKQAWHFALFGAAFVGGNYWGLWPLSTGQIVTLPLATAILFWGLSRLVVELAVFLKGVAAKWLSNRELKIQNEKARSSEAIEVRHNLETLSDLELLQLLWLLQRPTRRFDQRIEFSLVIKKVVVPFDIRNFGFAEVHQVVWADRQMLIDRYAKVRIPAGFPERGRVGMRVDF